MTFGCACRRATGALLAFLLTGCIVVGGGTVGGGTAGGGSSASGGASASRSGTGGTDPDSVIAAGVAAGLPRPALTVLGSLPHDTEAWTQGLEIADGMLYEGTGRVGHSQLRELDQATGRPVRTSPLPSPLYGEGITVVGPRIWQLTWRDGVAVEWDRVTFTPVRRVPLDGEGWGLCRTKDGWLISSDGTDRLRLHEPSDLAVHDTVPVRVNGLPLTGLNELECTPDGVWANVFETDWLVRIDLGPGREIGTVTAAVDAAGLLPPEQRPDANVLNGIAAIPGTDEFLLTGKYWPTIFRVRFSR